MKKISIIKKCPEKDKDDRPDSEQQYCLYTSDGDKLLGRHPTKEDALKQEQAIQIHKHQSVEKIANDILRTKKVISLNDLLNNPISKKAISLGELMAKTNKKSIKYTSGCTAELQKAMPRYGRWIFSVKCKESWSKGPYDTRFKLLKSKKKTKGVLGREIEISCNCNAWRYNGADYNALQKDYSERQYSNGEPPKVRDPRRKYLICKHVAACVPIIKEFIIPKQFK